MTEKWPGHWQRRQYQHLDNDTRYDTAGDIGNSNRGNCNDDTVGNSGNDNGWNPNEDARNLTGIEKGGKACNVTGSSTGGRPDSGPGSGNISCTDGSSGNNRYADVVSFQQSGSVAWESTGSVI